MKLYRVTFQTKQATHEGVALVWANDCDEAEAHVAASFGATLADVTVRPDGTTFTHDHDYRDSLEGEPFAEEVATVPGIVYADRGHCC